MENPHSRRRAIVAAVVVAWAVTSRPTVAAAQAPEEMPLEAAEPTGFGLSLVLGANHSQVKDEVLNNVVHRGTSASPFGLLLELRRPSVRHTVEVSVMTNSLASRYESRLASVGFDVGTVYRPTWTIPESVPNLSVGVGGVLAASTHFSLFESWDDSHAYYLTAYAMGAGATLRYRASPRWHLFFEVGFPLVALVARPESPMFRKADDPGRIVQRLHENIRLTSVHDYRGLTLDAGVTLRRLGWFEPTVFYRFAYAGAEMPGSRPLAMLTHVVGVRVGFARQRSQEER